MDITAPAPITQADVDAAHAEQQAAAAAFSALCKRPHTMVEFADANGRESRAYAVWTSLLANLEIA